MKAKGATKCKQVRLGVGYKPRQIKSASVCKIREKDVVSYSSSSKRRELNGLSLIFGAVKVSIAYGEY